MKHLLTSYSFALVAICLIPVLSHAEKPLQKATFTQVINQVYKREGKNTEPASVNASVNQNGFVITRASSLAELRFADNSITRVGENTIFSFNDKNRTIDLRRGTILLQTPPGNGGATIRTAAVTAAITGTTTMIAHVPSGGFMMTILESAHGGSVKTPQGTFKFKVGQVALVRPGKRPLIFEVNLQNLVGTSRLMKSFQKPLPSQQKIEGQIKRQQRYMQNGRIDDTGLEVVAITDDDRAVAVKVPLNPLDAIGNRRGAKNNPFRPVPRFESPSLQGIGPREDDLARLDTFFGEIFPDAPKVSTLDGRIDNKLVLPNFFAADGQGASSTLVAAQEWRVGPGSTFILGDGILYGDSWKGFNVSHSFTGNSSNNLILASGFGGLEFVAVNMNFGGMTGEIFSGGRVLIRASNLTGFNGSRDFNMVGYEGIDVINTNFGNADNYGFGAIGDIYFERTRLNNANNVTLESTRGSATYSGFNTAPALASLPPGSFVLLGDNDVIMSNYARGSGTTKITLGNKDGSTNNAVFAAKVFNVSNVTLNAQTVTFNGADITASGGVNAVSRLGRVNLNHGSVEFGYVNFLGNNSFALGGMTPFTVNNSSDIAANLGGGIVEHNSTEPSGAPISGQINVYRQK